MLIRWKNKDKEKDKCEKSSNQKQSSNSTSKKKRKFGRDGGKSDFSVYMPFVLFIVPCYLKCITRIIVGLLYRVFINDGIIFRDVGFQVFLRRKETSLFLNIPESTSDIIFNFSMYHIFKLQIILLLHQCVSL